MGADGRRGPRVTQDATDAPSGFPGEQPSVVRLQQAKALFTCAVVSAEKRGAPLYQDICHRKGNRQYPPTFPNRTVLRMGSFSDPSRHLASFGAPGIFLFGMEPERSHPHRIRAYHPFWVMMLRIFSSVFFSISTIFLAWAFLIFSARTFRSAGFSTRSIAPSFMASTPF